MVDKEFFYLDRPAAPATQQNLIDPDVLVEHAVLISAAYIRSATMMFATEVKDENGEIVGTVLYCPHTTFAGLTSEDELSEDDEVDEDDEQSDTETFDADEDVTFSDTQ